MEEQRLQSITFLRLYPRKDFNSVDEILSEIQTKNLNLMENKIPLTIPAETQTEEPSTPIGQERSMKLPSQIQDELIQPRRSVSTSSIKIRFSQTFSYNNEAEFADIIGRIGSRKWTSKKLGASFVDKECIETTSTPKVDESLETEQMRRLGEIAEWRRSLLLDKFV